jgi:hypothetical protein
VFDRPTRREFSALAFGLLAAGGTAVGAQQDEKKAAGKLPGPDPIPDDDLTLPTLPTVSVQRGAPTYNVEMIDTALLPRDRQGIWVLDFAFKPLRIRTLEVGGKRRDVYYLYYRVVNRTGKPREFVPQFTLITDTKKRYEESVIPKAVELVKAREDYSIPVLGAVDIAGVIPPSTKGAVDDAVFGAALWEGIDPHADRITIYVRGLSDGYKQLPGSDGGAAATKYKTLQINFIRRGDHRNVNEKEISRGDPPYEWIYW